MKNQPKKQDCLSLSVIIIGPNCLFAAFKKTCQLNSLSWTLKLFQTLLFSQVSPLNFLVKAHTHLYTFLEQS